MALDPRLTEGFDLTPPKKKGGVDPRILSAINDLPLPVNTAEPVVPESDGYLSTVGKGIVRGTEGMASGVGSITRWAGDVTGLDAVSQVGKETEDYWKNAAQTGFAKADEQTFAGSFMENPSFKRAFGIVGEAVPSLAAGVATGGAATLAAAGAGLAMPAALAVGAGVGAAGLGLLEGAPQYSEARDAGKDIGTASAVGGAATAGSALLEFLPISRILGRAGKGAIIGAVRGAVEEGAQEATQTVWQNLVAKVGYDNSRDLAEGIVESLIGGAGAGGAVGGVSGSKFFSAVDDAKAKGATDDELNAAANELARQVKDHQQQPPVAPQSPTAPIAPAGPVSQSAVEAIANPSESLISPPPRLADGQPAPTIEILEARIANLTTTAKTSPVAAQNLKDLQAQRDVLVQQGLTRNQEIDLAGSPMGAPQPRLGTNEKLSASTGQIDNQVEEADWTPIIQQRDSVAKKLENTARLVETFPKNKLYLENHQKNQIEFDGLTAQLEGAKTDGMSGVPVTGIEGQSSVQEVRGQSSEEESINIPALTLDQVSTSLAGSGFTSEQRMAVTAHLKEVVDYGNELLAKAGKSPQTPAFTKADIQAAIDAVITNPQQEMTNERQKDAAKIDAQRNAAQGYAENADAQGNVQGQEGLLTTAPPAAITPRGEAINQETTNGLQEMPGKSPQGTVPQEVAAIPGRNADTVTPAVAAGSETPQWSIQYWTKNDEGADEKRQFFVNAASERQAKEMAAQDVRNDGGGRAFTVSREEAAPVAPQTANAGEGVRQPWQMTLGEALGKRDEDVDWVQNRDPNTPAGQAHRKAVEQAIAEGKPVPQNVLKSYPWAEADRNIKPYVESLKGMSDEQLKVEEKKTGSELDKTAKLSGKKVTYFETSGKFNAVNKEIDSRKSKGEPTTAPQASAPAAETAATSRPSANPQAATVADLIAKGTKKNPVTAFTANEPTLKGTFVDGLKKGKQTVIHQVKEDGTSAPVSLPIQLKLRGLQKAGKTAEYVAPVAETATVDDTVPTFENAKPGEIYQTKVRRGDAVETMYAVPSGGQRGGGDTLHKTFDEAVKEQARKAEMDSANAASRARSAEIQAKEKENEDAAKAKRDDIDGYAADLSPMQRGAVLKSLNMRERYDGVEMARKEKIRELVANGEEVSTYETNVIKDMTRTQFNRASNGEQAAHEKKQREAGEKTVYLVGGYDMGKTGYDYAQHLKAAKPATAEAPVAPVTEAVGTPSEVVAEAVSTAKEEGTPLKEQKKYLLDNLDDAIKDAPEESSKKIIQLADELQVLRSDRVEAINRLDSATGSFRLWSDETKVANTAPADRARYVRDAEKQMEIEEGNIARLAAAEKVAKKALQDADAFVTIRIPDDGTFEVFNTKGAIKAFKEKVSKEVPAGPVSKPKTGYGENPKPTGAKASGLSGFFTMTSTDGLWHSDGHALIKGKEKIKAKDSNDKLQEMRDADSPEEIQGFMSRIIPRESALIDIDNVEFVARSANGEYHAINTDTIKGFSDEAVFVRLSVKGKEDVYIDQRYYLYILAHHPAATMKRNSVDTGPISFLADGETVAVVMPYSQRGEDNLLRYPKDMPVENDSPAERWNNSTPAERIDTAVLAGWHTNNGKPSGVANRLANQEWDAVSEGNRDILARFMDAPAEQAAPPKEQKTRTAKEPAPTGFKLVIKTHRAFAQGLTEGAQEFALKNNLTSPTTGRESAIRLGIYGANDQKAFIAAFELASNPEYVAVWRENRDLLNFALKRGDTYADGFEYVNANGNGYYAEEIEKPKAAPPSPKEEKKGEKVEASTGTDTGDREPTTLQMLRDSMPTNAKTLADVFKGTTLLDVVDYLANIKNDSLSFTPPANVINGQTPTTESLGEGMGEDVQSLRNILGSDAFLEQGFSGLDVKTQRLVLSHVSGLVGNKKVLDTVVQLVPVDVVNDLARQQLTPKMLFNDAAMLKSAISGDLVKNVPRGADMSNTLLRALTLAGAVEQSGLVVSDLVGPTKNNGTANATFDLDKAVTSWHKKTSLVDDGSDNTRHYGQSKENKTKDEGVIIFSAPKSTTKGTAPILLKGIANRARLADGWKVEVVATPADLPANVQVEMQSQGITQVEGVKDGGSQTVFLVANGLSSMNRAKQVLAHEMFHVGVIESELRDYLASLSPGRIAQWKRQNPAYAGLDDLSLANEMLANEAESNLFIKRIVGKINAWLKEMGINLQISQADVYSLIDAALTRATESGSQSQGINFGENPNFAQGRENVVGLQGTQEDIDALTTSISGAIGYDVPKGIFELVSLPSSQAEVVNAVSEIFKKRVVGVRNNGPDIIEFNGAVTSSVPDTIFIEENTPNPAITIFGHELTHLLRKDHPDIFNHLMWVADAELVSSSFQQYKDRLEQWSDSSSTRGFSDKGIREEMLADFIGDQMTKQAFWNKVAAANPSIFKEVAKVVQKFIRNVLSKLGLKTMGSNQFYRDLETMQEVVADALSEYATRQNVERGYDDILEEDSQFSAAFKRNSLGREIKTMVDDIKGSPYTSSVKPIELSGGFNENNGTDVTGMQQATQRRNAQRQLFEAVSYGNSATVLGEEAQVIAGKIAADEISHSDALTAFAKFVNGVAITTPGGMSILRDIRAHLGELGHDIPNSGKEAMAGLFKGIGAEWQGFNAQDVNFSVERTTKNGNTMTLETSTVFEGIRSIINERMDDPKWKDLAERFLYSWINTNDPRKRVYAAADRKTAKNDMVTAEELRGKKTAAEVALFREKVVEPMLKELAEAKLTVSDLEEYGHALHAPERNQRMREVNAKRTLDRFLSLMTEGEAQVWKNRTSDFIASNLEGKTFKEIQIHYLNLIDEIALDIAAREEKIMDRQDVLDRRTFTDAEIEAGTPERVQKSIDKAADDLEATKNLMAKWEDESPRLSGMTDEEADSIVSKWSSDPRSGALKSAKAKLDQINRAGLDALHDSGELSDEEYEGIVNGYQHYVPLMRDGFSEARPTTGRITGPTGKPLKVAMGSMREVVNIVAHSVQNYQTAVNRKHKAEAGRALYQFALDNPESGITVEKLAKKPTHDQEGNIILYPDQMEPENGVFVKIDGEKHLLEFDTDERTPQGRTLRRFLESIKESSTNIGPIMSALTKFNRYLAAVNTMVSPEFILSNFVRDFQTAFIHLSDEKIKQDKGFRTRVSKDIFPAILGIYRAENGNDSSPMSKEYREFAKEGGKIGWMQGYDKIENLAKDLEHSMKLYGEGHITLKKREDLKTLIASSNTAVENGVRLATYRNLRDSLIANGKSPELARKEAASIASKLTVDFTQKGKYGPAFNSLYLFANAGIQGNVRMITAVATSKSVQKIVGGIVVGGFALQLLALAGGDDDTGEPYVLGLPDFVRERNIIIMIPGTKGRYISIPMPYGYNGFNNIGAEAATLLYMGANGKDYNAAHGAMRVVTTFANSFNPLASGTIMQSLSPTITDPIVMAQENKDYAGRNLMPAQNQFGTPKPDSERYWKGVSPTSKYVAMLVNQATGGDRYEGGLVDMSPETLDMLYDTVTGSAGRFIANTVNLPYRALTDGLEANQTPVLRRVMGQWDDRAISDKYYEAVEKGQIAKQRFDGAETPQMKALIRQTPEFKNYIYSRAYDSSLSRLRKSLKLAEAQNNKVQVTLIRERILTVQKSYLSKVK